MKTTHLIPPLLSLAALLAACGDNEEADVAFDSTVVQQADDFTDPRDNNTYRCIRIGDQIWMAENLRYELPGNSLSGCFTWDEDVADVSEADVDDQTFRTVATAVANDTQYNGWPQYGNSRQTGTQVILSMVSFLDYGYGQDMVREYLAYYPDYYDALLAALDSAKDSVQIGHGHFLEAETANGGYVTKYGFLYSFEAAKQAVPEGWRLPSDDDWMQLERALGLSDGEARRSEAWRGKGLATLLGEGGASGFNATRAGGNTYIIKASDDNYVNKDENWYYWTSTTTKKNDSTEVAMMRMSAIYTDKVWRGTSPLTTGYRSVLYSVRCVRDAASRGNR